MSSLGKNFGLSSSLNLEEVMMNKKQGIVSILGSDSERTKYDASLRRTLSADMSSKKWLSQRGFFPLKKIASADDGFQVSSITVSSSSEEDDYEEGHKVFINTDSHLIKEEEGEEKEKKNAEKQQPRQFGIWSSILSQKAQAQEDPKNLPPPYVHPPVKRSASSLSTKSLEICTESLGSETGSDGFSSYQPSETGDTHEDKKEEQQQEANHQQATKKYDMEDWRVAKYKIAAATSSKKSSPKSFPPPIPSLSSQDGAFLYMRSRRDSGRLVLEAVSVPSTNHFVAQRQDGRLVLTFINKTDEEEQAPEEGEGLKNDDDPFESELDKEDGEEEETEENVEEELEKDTSGGGGFCGGDGDQLRFVMEVESNLSSRVISFYRLAPVMNKSMPLANRNTIGPKSLNKAVNFEEEEEAEAVEGKVEPISPLTQSLPPRPTVARMITSQPQAAVVAATAKAAASLNAYEYYWKPKEMAASRRNSNELILPKDTVANEQQELLVLWGNKGDYLVPFLKGCKEPRRSLLFWDPYCIATS